LDEDRIVVTANADDFRKLLPSQTVHPGLITLPTVALERSWQLLLIALAFLELQPDPEDFMINRAIEISACAAMRAYELPPSDETG
jgi:hypothetical protein